MEHPKDCTSRSTGSDALQQKLHDNKANKFGMFCQNFLAGGIAGAVSRTVQNSASLVARTNNAKGFDSLGNTFKRILKQEGILGLFKGNGTNILRIVPYSSMQFASYELFLKEPISTIKRLGAGAAAGLVAATFTYPLDLVRTRLSLATLEQSGVFACLVNVYRNEGGLWALYRGLFPTLLGIAPLVAINFTVYERLKHSARQLKQTPEVPVTIRLLCGGLAGAIAQTVTYPLDVLRRRLQSSGQLGFNYAGMADALKRMWREEGPGAFYRGLLPNYLKMVPAISVSFVVYEWMQSVLLN